jgi:hypothetical protein
MKKSPLNIQALVLLALIVGMTASANAQAPNFNVGLSPASPTVIKGATSELVLSVTFHNGFTTADGIAFAVHDPESALGPVTTFTPVPLKQPGHVVAIINTAGLDPGDYAAAVWATDTSTSTTVYAPFTLKVVTVGSISLYRTDPGTGQRTAVTSFTANRQGQVMVDDIGAEVKDTAGNVIPDAPLTVQSANPTILQIFPNQYGGHDVYADQNGATNVIFTTPDGFSVAVPATIAFADSPQVTAIGLNPMTVTNACTDTLFFSATATHLIGCGIQGMLAIIDEPSSPVWSNGNKTVSRTFKLNLTTPPALGRYLLNAFTNDGVASAQRIVALTIANDPAYAAMAGGVKTVSSGLPPFAMDGFMVEFYDTGGSLQFSRDYASYEHQDPKFTIGAILPGTYKIRYVPNPVVKPQWYPNSDTIDGATAVTFGAGATVGPIYFFARSAIEPGDIDGSGTIGLEDAIYGLKILANDPVYLSSPGLADINQDGRIGLPEVAYILQVMAGQRN